MGDRLAEAGASPNEIAAVLAHASARTAFAARESRSSCP
jgi:hypothetical protein